MWQLPSLCHSSDVAHMSQSGIWYYFPVWRRMTTWNCDDRYGLECCDLTLSLYLVSKASALNRLGAWRNAWPLSILYLYFCLTTNTNGFRKLCFFSASGLKAVKEFQSHSQLNSHGRLKLELFTPVLQICCISWAFRTSSLPLWLDKPLWGTHLCRLAFQLPNPERLGCHMVPCESAKMRW